MFRARAVRHACLSSFVVKECRSDDNSLGENIVIKPDLELLALQGKLISIDFYFIGLIGC